ncbi:alpha/beta hydrolase [Crossiella cryophila]|uniref:Pimeloyl-ACP methyl ester carboxylesterase n=1 Tax=Crossiella cryophila TaxID=43355 RepID=A0A7W7FTF5_9PSEU|nr:pimeloyl-ACP methyl ester carboxylesterase [Crossiella cryophila]
MRLLPKLFAVASACALLFTGLTAPQAAAQPVDCKVLDLPVTGPGLLPLLPGGLATVQGQLCLPSGKTPPVVQLLVHGGTYNRAYWDLPYQPERYSYQRDMAKAGFATFAVDRLGTGKSTKPLSLPMLLSVEADSMHQVVQHLRAGRVGGVPFQKVVIVGHSVGSGIVATEAAVYKDVDAVILSGITHLPALPVLGLGAVLGLGPALLDPLLGKRGSDPLWFATRPGARGPLFYNAANADPKVIEADEATKDQVSVPGMGTVAVFGIVLPTTLGINVPVFQPVGQKDILFCGLLALRDCTSGKTLRPAEAPYYTPAAKLETYVLPNAGHSLGLHKNAHEYREATRAWLRRTVGA